MEGSEMIALRDYQEAAVASVYEFLRKRSDNPCVVIPTGGGKTPVLARICLDATTAWSGRVLIVSHVKELLEQAVKTLHGIDPVLLSKVGVYSAGLGKREVGYPITVAGIQSVYKKATKLGAFNLIIVDEAHLIPLEGEGMYRQFLAEAKLVNPNVRVIGLTATPYRMKDGQICGEGNILNAICHETGVRELIARKFLCNLKSRAGSIEVDTSALHIRAGEFVQSEIEQLMDTEELVRGAVADILKAVEIEKRKAVLIFAAGVEHGGLIAAELRKTGSEVGEVYAETPSEIRADLVARFRAGALKYLVNMNVLTIGFDAPNVDMIALLRPTNSPGLYYQMVGRGFRIHPDKDYCLVLDYGNNVVRHGPVDLLKPEKKESGTGPAPAKKCPGWKCVCGKINDAAECECGAAFIPPRCNALIHTAYRVCPECGFEFPDPKKKHRINHSGESVLSEPKIEEVEVKSTSYFIHTKKSDLTAKKTLRVSYEVAGFRGDIVSEWVCIEHEGFAQRKAAAWWRARCAGAMPKTVAEAVELANDGALAPTLKIRIDYSEKFPRVISADLGPIPNYVAWQEQAVNEIEEEQARKARFASVKAQFDDPNYQPPF